MDIDSFKPKFDKAIDHLIENLNGLRSNRATPALVENIMVESYGTKMPLKQLANISVPQPRLLVIEPWDKNSLKDIEKGIHEAGTNLPVVNDGDVLRINLPTMTEEDKKGIVKLVHQYLEEAKISIRHIREEMMKQLKQEKENGEISEDDFFHQQKAVQQLVDEYNSKIKELGEAKEKEIMTV